MTPEDVHNEVRQLEIDFHREFGNFKADLLKTIWITQLSTIGIILLGVGLLLHFKV